MTSVNFDNYSDNYDEVLQKQLKGFDADQSYFAEYKVKKVFNSIKFQPRRILEYGCGTGRNLKFLRKYFPESYISGCDISRNCLETAKRKNPSVQFYHLASDCLPLKAQFELIFISCVFHHIPPNLRYNTMQRIFRLLREKGDLFVFEQNPINPVTRYMVNTCPFDEDAKLLRLNELKALIESVNLHVTSTSYTLFFPAILSFLRPLEKYMGKIPLGGQFFIRAEKK